MKIVIDLTPEESAEFQALAIRFGTSPEKILTQFSSDLTGSLRTHGSDERDYAMKYAERTFFDRQAEYCPEEEALSESEREKISQLQSDAWRHREAQKATWRAEHTKTIESNRSCAAQAK